MADPIILGSASPRRRELLGQLGVEFEVVLVDLDESGLSDGDVASSVERTSLAKYNAFATQHAALHGRRLLTADTLVAGAGSVLGKPTSAADAESTLARLSGEELTIASAVCCGEVGGQPNRRTVVTTVQLRPLSADEIRDYVATGAAADKAGALELQGRAASFIASMDGCWSNVVGLPLCATAELLDLPGGAEGWSPCSGRRCGTDSKWADRG